MSIEKPNEVIILSNFYADKVYISLDILEDNIMIKGWDKNSGKKIQDILDIYTNSKMFNRLLWSNKFKKTKHKKYWRNNFR